MLVKGEKFVNSRNAKEAGPARLVDWSDAGTKKEGTGVAPWSLVYVTGWVIVIFPEAEQKHSKQDQGDTAPDLDRFSLRCLCYPW